VPDGAALAAEAARVAAWAGSIPAVFTLAADEVTTLQPPPSFHINLPRQSFLPLVTGPVVEHFLPFAPPMARASAMWLQHAGEPLRWQVPVGVLYDLLVGADDDAALPWRLVVRFQGGPVGQPHGLLRSSVEQAKALVRCALKESSFLRCGSARPVMDLNPAEDARIFQALSAAALVPPITVAAARGRARSSAGGWAPEQAGPPSPQQQPGDDRLAGGAPAKQPPPGNAQSSPRRPSGGAPAKPPPPPTPYQTFSGAHAPLEAAVASVLCGKPERAVPLRVFVAQAEWRQLPVAPELPASGGFVSLGGALAIVLPELFGTAADAEAQPAVLVQGVAVELSTPLPWLYRACAHPDGFLYVSCRQPPVA